MPDTMTRDVRDLHRGGRTAARMCADVIDDALAVVVPLNRVRQVGGIL